MAVALAGCSVLGVQGPNEPAPGEPPMVDAECTTSRALPIADLVGALLFVGGGLLTLVEARAGKGNSHSGMTFLMSVPTGLGFAVSSIIGFDRTGSCRGQAQPEPVVLDPVFRLR